MGIRIAAAMIVLLGSSLHTAAAGSSSVLPVRPTTSDAAKVYEAFLSSWRGTGRHPVNVARSASAPEPGDIAKYTKCAEANESGIVAWTPGTPIDALGGTLGHLSYVHLVDPLPQDPRELFAKMQSMARGEYSDGFLILSAVTFDASHETAALTYAFACGPLCGHGGFATFKRTSAGWAKDMRPCASGWVSSR